MKIKLDTMFTSSTGKTFRVVSVDKIHPVSGKTKGGFTVERTDTGTTQKISGNLLKKCRARMEEPGFSGFLKQASFPKGGISYTVAEATAAATVLGLKLSSDGKRWVK